MSQAFLGLMPTFIDIQTAILINAVHGPFTAIPSRRPAGRVGPMDADRRVRRGFPKAGKAMGPAGAATGDLMHRWCRVGTGEPMDALTEGSGPREGTALAG